MKSREDRQGCRDGERTIRRRQGGARTVDGIMGTRGTPLVLWPVMVQLRSEVAEMLLELLAPVECPVPR